MFALAIRNRSMLESAHEQAQESACGGVRATRWHERWAVDLEGEASGGQGERGEGRTAQKGVTPAMNGKRLTYKGVTYWGSFQSARAYGERHHFEAGWRVVEYRRGYAIQRQVSGPYWNIERAAWA